ncbi:T9SS type A sorting domain-containing protein, partial [Hymenobacter persicinus]
PGGTATSTGVFTVIVPNPVPTIVSMTPNSVARNTPSFTITLTGTNFLSSSVVNFNGTALTTTFVSATSLTALVPASAVMVAGTVPVTVTNPAPGGGTSAPVVFTILMETATLNGQALAGFALYPNPTVGEVTIELPKTWTNPNQPVRLTDLTGRTVLQTRLGADGKLNLSQLSAGVYLVTIGEGPQQIMRRVVKN